MEYILRHSTFELQEQRDRRTDGRSAMRNASFYAEGRITMIDRC